MNDFIVKVIWQKVILNLWKILMYRIPSFLLICVFLVTWLGCDLFRSKPSTDLIPVQVASSERVIQRVNESDEVLEGIEKQISSLQLKVDGENEKKEVLIVKELFAKYVEFRGDAVKNILKFMLLSNTEYEQLYILSYGELPEKVKNMLHGAINQLNEAIEKRK